MNTIDWRLQVANAYFGEVVYHPGGVFGPRVQPNIQLVVIHRGEAHVRIDETSFHLPAQHVSLHWPGH